jgi:hypothetical protein
MKYRNSMAEDKDHELIRKDLQMFAAKIESNFDEINNTLESILAQALKTNGRVNALEGDTDIIRIFKKYKFFIAVFALGIYQLFKLTDIGKWISMIF